MTSNEVGYQELAETQEAANILPEKKGRTPSTILIIHTAGEGVLQFTEITEGKSAAEKALQQIGHENVVKIFKGTELKPQVQTTVKL